jgi:uncharacterized damage-inducible protein DinB
MVDAMVQELEQEAATTRRVLERVPADKFSWKPHPRSMSLGQLALHVAQSPGAVSAWALEDTTDFSGGFEPPLPTSKEELLAAHDSGLGKTKDVLQKLGDAGMKEMWQGKANGATLMTMPKAALVRAVVLNHWIHHRGQLSVYLRLLDVPVPAIYGASADENPFAARV